MVVTFDVLGSCVMVFRREQPARRLTVGHFANNNMLKMKYRKT